MGLIIQMSCRVCSSATITSYIYIAWFKNIFINFYKVLQMPHYRSTLIKGPAAVKNPIQDFTIKKSSKIVRLTKDCKNLK